MKYVGYYNGEIGPLEEMKIPMLDRAVYFGDGYMMPPLCKQQHFCRRRPPRPFLQQLQAAGNPV